ncbi:hypothetical protein AAVH_26332, partial [Aphelenchoides avenae]
NVSKVNARKRGNRMLEDDEVIMKSKRKHPDECIFLEVKATQGESLRDDDDDDRTEVDDNRSQGSRRSRYRDDDGYDEDNLNYERSD